MAVDDTQSVDRTRRTVDNSKYVIYQYCKQDVDSTIAHVLQMKKNRLWFEKIEDIIKRLEEEEFRAYDNRLQSLLHEN